MAKVNVKFRLHMMESERGWGQDYWHEDYDTRAEAEARQADVNARNIAPVAPDYYVRALNIEMVEAETG